MSEFSITILGNNSAIPCHGRHPSAQYLKIGNEHILVDCGEGTQLRLRQIPTVSLFHISHIFITHLHGDHYLGLMGLLSTLGLMRRTKPIHIFSHVELQEIIEMQLTMMGGSSPFDILFHNLPLEGEELICDENRFSVKAFQLEHRIPCCGFLFTEKFEKKKVNKAALEENSVPLQFWNEIQRGMDYQPADGVLIKNEELTQPSPKPRTYAYCSDTRYFDNLNTKIAGVDTAYIETTYTEKESELAVERFHCTAKQAAEVAQQAKIGRLMIGHFSSRYKNLSPFLTEARAVFPQTELAEEGKTFEIELW